MASEAHLTSLSVTWIQHSVLLNRVQHTFWLKYSCTVCTFCYSERDRWHWYGHRHTTFYSWHLKKAGYSIHLAVLTFPIISWILFIWDRISLYNCLFPPLSCLSSLSSTMCTSHHFLLDIDKSVRNLRCFLLIWFRITKLHGVILQKFLCLFYTHSRSILV